MRVISFEHAGHVGVGILTERGIVDVRRHLSRPSDSLRDLLMRGSLDEIRPLSTRAPDLATTDITYRPLIADPGAKLLCIGINYLPHMREMGLKLPEFPAVFVRFVDSLVGHEQPMIRPLVSEQYDFEGELAVVIGKRARHVPRDQAYEYVAGFSCFNDGSVRDYQRHGPQWTPGKNFHHSGAFGPCLVTLDEQPDPTKLRLRTTLNGQVVQDESIGELCCDVPHLIEYCSTWAELLPGDVIVTGTPGGVGAGRNPPLWMKNGDTVEVEISGVGTLRNTIRDEIAGS